MKQYKFEVYLSLLEFYINSDNKYKCIKYLEKIKNFYFFYLKNNLKLKSIDENNENNEINEINENNENNEELFNQKLFLKNNIDDVQEIILEDNSSFSHTSIDLINFR